MPTTKSAVLTNRSVGRGIQDVLSRWDGLVRYCENGALSIDNYAESFFRRLRDELLNCKESANLAEARWFAKRRRHEHYEERPHNSLSYQTPPEFASQCAASVSVAALPTPRQHPPRIPYSSPTLITGGTENRGIPRQYRRRPSRRRQLHRLERSLRPNDVRPRRRTHPRARTFDVGAAVDRRHWTGLSHRAAGATNKEPRIVAKGRELWWAHLPYKYCW